MKTQAPLPLPRIALLLMGLLVSGPAAADPADPSVDVPLSSPVYAFLDRMEARGALGGPLPGDRPWSEGRVARLLARLCDLEGRGLLSRAEGADLARFRSAFSDALHDPGRPSPAAGKTARSRLADGSIYAYRDSAVRVAVRPLARQTVTVFRGAARQEETVSETRLGARVEGEAFGRFGFRIGHFEAREWTTGFRRTRKDVVATPIEDVQFKGAKATPSGAAFRGVDFREARWQLVWAVPWFSLDVGKEAFDWGPSRDANLFLHHGAPSYVYARLRVDYGRVRFIHVVAALRARPGALDTARTTADNGHVQVFAPQKRMAAHRLEVAVGGRLRLGLQEAVVYGRRGFDFGYLAPPTVFIGAQTYLGNTDNVALGLDAVALLPGRTRVYAALFFDDLRKFSPGAFANKLGLQVGAFAVDPLGLRDSDLRVEYVRVEPYVYTHDFSINTWEHFDALLGHPAGPNADRLSAWFQRRVTGRLLVTLRFSRERRGENPVAADGRITNVGGDAGLGRRPSDPETKAFLSGIRETERRLGLAVTFDASPSVRLRAAFEQMAVGNAALATGRGDGASRWIEAVLEVNAF